MQKSFVALSRKKATITVIDIPMEFDIFIRDIIEDGVLNCSQNESNHQYSQRMWSPVWNNAEPESQSQRSIEPMKRQ